MKQYDVDLDQLLGKNNTDELTLWLKEKNFNEADKYCHKQRGKKKLRSFLKLADKYFQEAKKLSKNTHQHHDLIVEYYKKASFCYEQATEKRKKYQSLLELIKVPYSDFSNIKEYVKELVDYSKFVEDHLLKSEIQKVISEIYEKEDDSKKNFEHDLLQFNTNGVNLNLDDENQEN